MTYAGRGRHQHPASRVTEVPLVAADPADLPVPLPHPDLWRASVVVPTHNDAANLPTLLEGLLAEPSVGEVVVVASGCTDHTVDAVAAVSGHGRVRLFVEGERSGKASAINFAVTECRFDRVLIVSGDVLLEAGATELLLDALDDPAVGMAGGRVVPVDVDADVIGAAVSVLWELHHRLATKRPKLGEAIAVRAAAIEPLPRTSVDEATFQAVLEQSGWASRYVADAHVLNRGPGTARDFIRQRRRIHAGHLRLRRTNHYTVPSLDSGLLVREFGGLLAEHRSNASPRWVGGVATAVALELTARALARMDEYRRKDAHVWTIVESAKHPAPGAHRVGADGGELVAGAGMAAAAPGQRDREHELPVQLHVRDVQRVRAQGGRAQR